MKILRYFQELLATLKRIEAHLETLASTVSRGDGSRSYPALRTGKNQYDH